MTELEKLAGSAWRTPEGMSAILQRLKGWSSIGGSRHDNLKYVKGLLGMPQQLEGVEQRIAKAPIATLTTPNKLTEAPETLFRGHTTPDPGVTYDPHVFASPFMTAAEGYGRIPKQDHSLVSTYAPKGNDKYYRQAMLARNQDGKTWNELAGIPQQPWWKRVLGQPESSTSRNGPISRSEAYEVDVKGRAPTGRYFVPQHEMGNATVNARHFPMTPGNDAFIRELQKGASDMNAFILGGFPGLTKRAGWKPPPTLLNTVGNLFSKGTQAVTSTAKAAPAVLGSAAKSTVLPAVSAAARPAAPGAAYQAGRMALYGVGGSMTADEMGGPATVGQFHVGSVPINPLGFAAGAAMGHHGARNSSFGQTMARPFYNAAAGSLAGAGVDAVTGGHTAGQIGGWAGFGSGFAGNAHSNAAASQFPNIGGMQMKPMNAIQRFGGHANQMADQIQHGGGDVLRLAGNAAKRVALGTPMPAGAQVPRGYQYLGRQIGRFGAAAPIGIGVGGALWHNATGAANNAVDKKINQVYDVAKQQIPRDVDNFMATRGLTDANGQFDPFLKAEQHLHNFANPLMQMLGQHMPGGVYPGMGPDGNPQFGGPGMPHPNMPQQQQAQGPGGRNELQVQNDSARRLAMQHANPHDEPTGQGWL